jgi:hypothetical protein
MMFLGLLCKQGVTGSIPVTSTIYLPTNQSVANSDITRLVQSWSNKKFLHAIHRSPLLRRDRMQIYLPRDLRRSVALMEQGH